MRTVTGFGLNSFDTQAQINLFLDKALADAGLALPVSLTAYVGNASVSGFYAYSDPTGTIDDNYDDFRSSNNSRDYYPIGLDVGYQNYVTVRGIYDFFWGDDGYMFSAKSTPIDGVDVALFSQMLLQKSQVVLIMASPSVLRLTLQSLLDLTSTSMYLQWLM